MPPLLRLSVFVGSVALIGCANPRVQANMAEAINEFGTEVSGIRQDMAVMQSQIDSLREVAAKQDTMISKLSALAGINRN